MMVAVVRSTVVVVVANGDYSVHALMVDLAVAVALTNDELAVVGTPVGTMDLVDVVIVVHMIVVLIPGIADN